MEALDDVMLAKAMDMQASNIIQKNLHPNASEQSAVDGRTVGKPDMAGLTGVLLSDLSEISLELLGCDPLASFDSKVVLLSGRPARVYCSLETGIICMSMAMIEAFEFCAAHAVLTRISGQVLKRMRSDSNVDPTLLKETEGANKALYALLQARLLLHLTGEEPLPRISERIPNDFKPFVHQQTVLCTVFSLLHEQAHIEFYRERFGKQTTPGSDVPLVIETFLTNKDEEFAADLWALLQVPGPSRVPLVKAALFFFLTHWTMEYIAYRPDGDHPIGMERVERIVRGCSELGAADLAFEGIMLRDLQRISRLRRALEDRSQESRYAGAVKYCRQLSEFTRLEHLADALRLAYEEYRTN